MLNWTHIGEGLPEDGQRVLVYGDYPVYAKEGKVYRRAITTGKYDLNSEKWKIDGFIGFREIAWMPLPEPPRGC